MICKKVDVVKIANHRGIDAGSEKSKIEFSIVTKYSLVIDTYPCNGNAI